MNSEAPGLSLYELLFVPEGPPETVWERALDVAFAAGEQDDGGELDAADHETALGDTDAEVDDDHEEDWATGSSSHQPGNLPEAPGRDEHLAGGDGDGVGD